ncbi:MAG: hypothetical protein ABEI52_08790, partial [Halobacteriaceae archaeon]
DVVTNLIGFEIVEHGNKQCAIRATATPSEREFSQLLNRVFNIIEHTQDRTRDALRDGFQQYKTVASLTKDARRFLLFCTRTLHKKHIGPRKDESFFHLLLERLILIQHDHKYIYQKLDGEEAEFNSDVVELYDTVCDMFELFREAFHAGELRQFATINKEWHRIYFTRGHELLDNCSEHESVVIYHALHLSQLIFLIAQPNLVRQQAHVNW